MPIRRDVVSGSLLAAKIVGTLVALGILGRGLHLVQTGSLVSGTALVAVMACFLVLTAHRWAKWFFAACVANALRFTIMAFLGRTVSYPSIAAPRIVFVEAIGIAVVMAVLTYRFADQKPTRLDAVCLVGALIATVYSLLTVFPLKTMLVAILFLAISFAVEQLSLAKARRIRARSADGME